MENDQYVHFLYMRYIDKEGLHYAVVDMGNLNNPPSSNSEEISTRQVMFAENGGIHYDQAVFIGDDSRVIPDATSTYTLTAFESYAVGATTKVNAGDSGGTGSWNYSSAYESGAIVAILDQSKCDTHFYEEKRIDVDTRSSSLATDSVSAPFTNDVQSNSGFNIEQVYPTVSYPLL